VLPRLRSWLAASEIVAIDPERVPALARALDDDDPPVAVGRWGTVTAYDPDPGRRRLVQFDRRGHLIAAFRWRSDGALAWAKCRTAAGDWVGIEPGTATHPGWGASDRVWRLDGAHPWAPREAVTVFQSIDYARLDFIPPLAEPRRLPPAAGTAILDLLAGLMKDQGAARVRYRGPYPTEQLFTALLESFRYNPTVSDPFERFLDGGVLDWLPAPHERHHVAESTCAQLRQEIDKVVRHGVSFYRADWQGIRRREPRVIRVEGERAVCSLWALGRPIEDVLVLDRSGEVLEAHAPTPSRAAPAALPPVWAPALGDLIARESVIPLAGAIGEAVSQLRLWWGDVPGDLVHVDGTTITLSRNLRASAMVWLQEARPGVERAERAVQFVLEVARLLAPTVRRLAQAHLEARSEEEQRRALEPGDAGSDVAPLSPSVGRLLALIAAGTA